MILSFNIILLDDIMRYQVNKKYAFQEDTMQQVLFEFMQKTGNDQLAEISSSAENELIICM